MKNAEIPCRRHKRHRAYLGGPMDGQLDHLIGEPAASDVHARQLGARTYEHGTAWYSLIDPDAEPLTYRYVGTGHTFEQAAARGTP